MQGQIVNSREKRLGGTHPTTARRIATISLGVLRGRLCHCSRYRINKESHTFEYHEAVWGTSMRILQYTNLIKYSSNYYRNAKKCNDSRPNDRTNAFIVCHALLCSSFQSRRVHLSFSRAATMIAKRRSGEMWTLWEGFQLYLDSET